MKKLLLLAFILIINCQLSIINCSAQYTKLLDFTGTANGSYSQGSLISDGTFLYRMAGGGGANGYGVVFKIKPDGTGYSDLHDFSGANGSYPGGYLISDGTFLYGMTYGGGANSYGVVFKIKPDGTGYSDLHDFSWANGKNPYGSLISTRALCLGTS